MKLIILLLAITFGFGASVKSSVDELKKINDRHETNGFKHHPNMLPEVVIVAPNF